jgi:hypothetical protein
MFKNSDSDSDTGAGHTRSGRVFRGVHLANLFKKNYRDEGFYSGEEADLTDEEHLNPLGQRKKQLKNFARMSQKPQELRRLRK